MPTIYKLFAAGTTGPYREVGGGTSGQDGANGIFSEIATQPAAEAGVNNTAGMTPLRTKQAITAQASLLGHTHPQSDIVDLDDALSELLRADGTVPLSGDMDGGGFRLTNIAESSADTDAVTRAEAYALADGLKDKENVKVASTANIGTLSTLLTVDGVTLIAGDRVLVKDQTTGSQNGIYIASTGSWSRSTDADADAELMAGTRVFALFGTQYGKTSWTMITPSVTVGTTSQQWTQTAGSGGGEANVGANAGDGAGLFYKIKTGISLYFRAAKAASSRVSVATVGDNVEIDVVQGNLDRNAIGGASPLSLANGGTNGTTAATARTGLELNNVTNDAQVKRSEMGTALGVAELDSDGLVPLDQLPATLGNALPRDGSLSMQGPLSMAGNRIVNVANPVSDLDAVNRATAQAIGSGLYPKTPVIQATVAALPAFTFNTSTNELTVTANGVLVIDGAADALQVGQRVLVKNQGTAPFFIDPYNGPYTVTALGSVSTQAKLKRATDADAGTELARGYAVIVKTGNADNLGRYWVQSTRGTLALNSTGLQFTEGPKAVSSGGGAISIDVSATASPYELTADQAMSGTIILTGTRMTPLSISSPVAGGWIIENQTGQNVLVLAATGSIQKAPLANDETRQFVTDLTAIYASDPLTKYGIPLGGLQMYLQSGGVTGTTWADASGNSNDGTLTNGPVAGVVDGLEGVTFDGTNDVVNIATNFGIISSSDVTIFARAKFTGSDKGAFFVTTDALGMTGIGLYVGDGLDPTMQGNTLIGLLPGTSAYSSSTIPTGTHTVALVFTPGSMEFYIDGASVGTTAVGTLNDTTLNQSYVGEGFDSTLFDVLLYDVALTDGQVMQLHLSI